MNAFNEYEEVIDRDVRSRNYSRDLKLLKIAFFMTIGIFFAIYYFAFHHEILDNFKFIVNTYRASLVNIDYEFKMLVYNFNKMMAFLVFLFFFGAFCLVSFFAYDITARNRVIGYYQKKIEELEKKV